MADMFRPRPLPEGRDSSKRSRDDVDVGGSTAKLEYGRDSSKRLRASKSCSVCFEEVGDSRERSIAILKCGHYFHLDCIGSAFNAKGAMQCPNCRHVEGGRWIQYTSNPKRRNNDVPIQESAVEHDRGRSAAEDTFVIDGVSPRDLDNGRAEMEDPSSTDGESDFQPDHGSFDLESDVFQLSTPELMWRIEMFYGM